ncbi:MAG TPA: hypothetical protein VLC92_20730 [Rhodocyclaceae bacterium]|nr:hypothetical protein [Rhodocyclaceae bacterium]
MKRTIRGTVRAVCVGVAALALAGTATLSTQAFAQQAGMQIPAEAKKAVVEFSGDGRVGLNGKLSSLSAASQIRDTTNLIVLPQALRGKYQMRVILDSNGAIHRAWIIDGNK